jgi:two-component system chemotaxis response regulator CheB
MTNFKPLRVLVIDDTVLYRKIISDILSEIPGVEVVGTANNGKIAMSRIASLQPDLITLDVEMPEVNGLDVLTSLKEQSMDVGAIMLSSFTRQGSDITIKALELGAFDFISKPDTRSMTESKQALAGPLVPMIHAFIRRREISSILRGKVTPAGGAVQPARKAGGQVEPAGPERAEAGPGRMKPEIVAIAISTGGPNALARMLPQIPVDLGVPIVIVQHMPPMFTQSLAASLNAKCGIEVREAAEGQALLPNVAFIAPGGKQMKIVQGPGLKERVIRITDDPPENSCKPSADYLFRSIAYLYKGRAAGVVMTGMGSDGALGLKLMKRYGARIIAQDEATCVVYGMPKAPVEAGIVDVIAPLDQIAAHICKLVRS